MLTALMGLQMTKYQNDLIYRGITGMDVLEWGGGWWRQLWRTFTLWKKIIKHFRGWVWYLSYSMTEIGFNHFVSLPGGIDILKTREMESSCVHSEFVIPYSSNMVVSPLIFFHLFSRCSYGTWKLLFHFYAKKSRIS